MLYRFSITVNTASRRNTPKIATTHHRDRTPPTHQQHPPHHPCNTPKVRITHPNTPGLYGL